MLLGLLCATTHLHSLSVVLSPIMDTLMTPKKEQKGRMKRGVLGESYNFESQESLNTPISSFQLTFKLNQMAFKKHPLPIGELWSFGCCIHAFFSGSDWKAVTSPTVGRCFSCLWMFLQGLWSVHSIGTRLMFTSWSWGFQLSLHIEYLLWTVAGLISPWNQREIKPERLHLFSYYIEHIN